MGQISCQKIFFDWLFPMALVYLKNIPHLTFFGYVKHSTREKWEATFVDEYAGRQHDTSHAIQLIQSTPWQRL
jgi:hypothetical protein